MEFFGNTIESIRLYDPTNQRSVKRIASISIGPATELLLPFAENGSKLEDLLKSIDFSNCGEETQQTFIKELGELYRGQKNVSNEFYAPLFNQDSLLSFLPDNTLLIIDEPLSVQRIIDDFDNKAVELYRSQQEQGELPANFPKSYFNRVEIEPALGKMPRLMLTRLGISAKTSNFQLDFKTLTSYGGQIPNFIPKIKKMLAEKRRLIVVTHQANRLSEVLGRRRILSHLS